MSDTPQDLAQVETLLAERDALHGWLARLDAVGSSTPASVRDRVRADYQARLDTVGQRLAGHRDILDRKLAEDRAEHDDLASRMQAARDALAEVELRHSVGEYDGERFEEERASHVGDLESYEVSLGAVAERIARLEDAQALVLRAPEIETGAAAAGGAEDRIVPIGELEAVADDGEVEDAPRAEVAEEAPAEDALQTEALLAVFGEREVLIEVEQEDEQEDPPAPTLESDEAEEEAGEGRSEPEIAGFGPLSFTRSGEVPVAKPRSAPPPLGMPSADQTPRFVRPGSTRGSEIAEGVGRPEESIKVIHDPEPMVPEVSVESEVSPRTLRCAECGAMNRPLEWYCEKCGAELSAV